MPPTGAPWLTANQVTLLRIVLLPVPCALVLYAPAPWPWVAIALYVALGFTDLLDGWMARRWGTTVLGGLLDPVADKVFMAVAVVLLAVLGMAHPAVMVLILARDFLITSLRSAMSLRGVPVKTSVVAKLKTAIQMGGAGVIYIVHELPADRDVWLALGGLALVAAAIIVWRYTKTRRVSPFVFVPSGAVITAFLLRLIFPAATMIGIAWAIIVAFTVVSAADYLGGAWTILARGAGHRVQDLGRILWTGVAGGWIPLLAVWRPETAPLVLVLLAAEFSTGAVDNLRCHEGFLPHAWIFPLRAAALAGGAALALHLPHDGTAWSPCFWAVLGLAALMLAWTLVDFVVPRHLIWGERPAPTGKAGAGG